MFRNKWLIFGLIIVVIAAVAGFFIYQAGTAGVEVKVARVKTEKILSTLSASGLVRAESVKLGSARMAGRVERVGVEEGDRVEKGHTLVELDGFEQAKKEYLRLKTLHFEGYVSDLELERAKTAVDNARVVAPISGVVTEKAVTVGEAISPGVPVVTIVDIDNPWVEIQVDEVDIARVKLDQRVRFTTDAFPDDEFVGKISWINKKAELKKIGGRVRMDEEDLVFRGNVELEDGKDVLKPGMSVYAEIIVGEKENALVVPREAIALRQGKRIAYVVKGEIVRVKEVEIGLKDAEKVEILKGLMLGEDVVISNLDKLKDKARIRLIKK